jgi:6-phosphogluconolactonase/glucosamine-6-phosphate isomerase/deaminase
MFWYPHCFTDRLMVPPYPYGETLKYSLFLQTFFQYRVPTDSATLQERKRRVIPVAGPKPPFERLAITPQVIAKARSVFMLATGSAKATMLFAALNNPNDIAPLPVRLTLGGT